MPLYSFAKEVDDITFMTENYPPYNFKQNDKIQGISVDILVLMLEKLKAKTSRQDIRMLPWARSYAYLHDVKNTALFSMTRTKHREEAFKWVGPIALTTISLIAKKSHHIKIESIKDIQKYKIGAIRDDIGEQLLRPLGVPSTHIEDVGGIDALYKLIKMLDKERFDMLSYEQSVTAWEQKKRGFDSNDYEVVFKLKKASLYYAFHKETPNKLINELQTALDELKKEGKYQQIVNDYLK